MADSTNEWDDLENFLERTRSDSNDEGNEKKSEPKASLDVDKLRKEIEDSVVEAIAKGDTKSGVYKGLQRELAKRDREVAELKRAHAELSNRVATGKDGPDEQFLLGVIGDMLDEDGKRALRERVERYSASKTSKRTEDMIKAFMSGQTQPEQNQGWYPYGQNQETPEEAEYRDKAEAQLKAFAKRMGVDPDSDELDLGDRYEPLVARMSKLSSSIERLQDKKTDQEIDDVKDSGNRMETRTNTSPKQEEGGPSGYDLLSRGARLQIEKFRSIRS